MTFLLFIAIAVLFVMVLGNRSRVSHLEQKLGVSTKEKIIKIETNYQRGSVNENTHHTTPEQPVATEPPIQKIDIVGWFKEDWMLKSGILLLLIGFGWFVSYAFVHNWIGPFGRITLGLLAGIITLAIGEWRGSLSKNQGGAFMILGLAVILITIFAAREVYDFFTPITALGIVFIAVAYVSFASVRYEKQLLAIFALAIAFISPLMVHFDWTADRLSIIMYLLVATLGAIWLTFLRGWKSLTLLSLVGIFLYSLPYIFEGTLQEQRAFLPFVFLFSAIFFLTHTTGIVMAGDSKSTRVDIITLGLNALFIITWVLVAVSSDLQSLLIAAVAAIYAVGSFGIYLKTQNTYPFFAYGGVGVVLLGVATAMELEGSILTIAFILEASVISILGYLLTNKVKVGEYWSLLLMIPIFMSVESIASSSWRSGFFHKDFFVLFLLMVALLGLGLFFKKVSEKDSLEESKISNISIAVGSLYGYILIWLILHSLEIERSVATMGALITYTVIGLFKYFYGLSKGINYVKYYGGFVVAFVIGRLLLVDVWQMPLAGRIITFLAVGVLLVATAFLTTQKRKEIEQPTI